MDLSTLPRLPDELHPDAVLYASRMAEIRTRLARVRAVVGKIRAEQKQDDADIETIFIQFRKCSELIAFGSLIANREVYSQHHADFASDWRLKRIIDKLKKLNPDFYPVPVSPPVATGPGRFHLEKAVRDFITEEELVTLYNTAGRILHSRNPFSGADSTHDIGYSVDEWIRRIETLLRWHYIQQTHSSRWLVEVPQTGDVHVYPSIAAQE